MSDDIINTTPALTQKVSIGLLQTYFGMIKVQPALVAELRLYLCLRLEGQYTGGYVDLHGDYVAAFCSKYNFSRSFMYKCLRGLRRDGLVAKLKNHKGKTIVHVNSINVVRYRIGISSSVSTEYKYEYICDQKNFKAFCLSFHGRVKAGAIKYEQNRKAFGLRTARKMSITNITPKEIGDEVRFSWQLSTTLLSNSTGVSAQYVSKLKKVAVDLGLIECQHRYCRKVGLVSPHEKPYHPMSERLRKISVLDKETNTYKPFYILPDSDLIFFNFDIYKVKEHRLFFQREDKKWKKDDTRRVTINPFVHTDVLYTKDDSELDNFESPIIRTKSKSSPSTIKPIVYPTLPLVKEGICTTISV